jgi:hypothetical protein
MIPFLSPNIWKLMIMKMNLIRPMRILLVIMPRMKNTAGILGVEALREEGQTMIKMRKAA